MRSAKYADVRDRMDPGDLIFFGGKGGISDGIKLFTRSATSHVGIVRHVRMREDSAPDRYFNEVIESTSLDGKVGVVPSRLSARVVSYPGDIWWAPLADGVRERLRLQDFWDWLYAQEGKPALLLASLLTNRPMGLPAVRRQSVLCARFIMLGKHRQRLLLDMDCRILVMRV